MKAKKENIIKDLKPWLLNRLAKLLRIPAKSIDPAKPFTDYGLTSIQAVSLSGELSKKFNQQIPPTIFWDINNLDQLIIHLENLMQQKTQVTTKQKVLAEPKKTAKAAKPKKSRQNLSKYFPEIEILEKMQSEVKKVTGESIYFWENEGIATSKMKLKNKDYINFSIYNYLNLSGDTDVSNFAKAAIDKYGTSASASRIAGGEKPLHAQLEEALSKLLQTEDCIVFNSGHATNVSVIGNIMKKNDLIVCDKLSHNSIIQGTILSGSTVKYFEHNDYQSLEKILAEHRKNYRRVLIVIEGVYSMDGDIPDLPKIIAIKNKYQALLFIDEAHSIGVLGATGGGIREYFNIDASDVEFWMGTLSKAFASCGGYIAGSKQLINFLKYTIPGFVYSCGLTPADTAAALAAVRKMQASPEIVATLHQRAQYFLKLLKEGNINTGNSHDTPVIPVIVGNSAHAIKLATELRKQGLFVYPIFYPTVEEGAARLRFFVTASHTKEQLDFAAKLIIKEYNKLSKK